jgi:hypothetical protein
MPTHEVPQALQDFLKHRQHLKDKETAPAVKKRLGITDHKGKAELEQSIQGIIDKKPNKKIVKEFFKERVKELMAVKMK